MLYGAQLYTVRDKCQTKEDQRETMKKMKELGYESVQVSAFSYDAPYIRSLADEYGLHIGLTHTPIPEIIGNTDKVIADHRALGADVVGIGYPTGYITQETGEIFIEKLAADISAAEMKLKDAGLKLAYHNHFLEFAQPSGVTTLDWLYDHTGWLFILDVGWAHYAGADCCELIRRYKDRLKYVHLKDFRMDKKDDKNPTDGNVPLFYGDVPLEAIIRELEAAGTQAAYAEQDNILSGDSIEEMRRSMEQLKKHGFVK